MLKQIMRIVYDHFHFVNLNQSNQNKHEQMFHCVNIYCALFMHSFDVLLLSVPAGKGVYILSKINMSQSKMNVNNSGDVSILKSR